ncbi:hypothetical protein LOTGIDRAFT_156951 [Lottia gigantea]|uniref:FAST kinase leucine-rich domain-containing protein n=1 Tax=Lottia gigantea TaxID=225164 RepID=V4AZ34_LOTGI|nr:hypothetical protein LOTGIDRAFT_156951 [Lottia gigantea]ESP02993.1 hypothetical protein LOTGIDRAFT_156951 [Lottia gigantea]
MLDLAKDVSDLQSASIYVGHLCKKLSLTKDANLTDIVMKDERLMKAFSHFALDNENKQNVPDTYILNLLFSLYKLHPFHCPLITVAELYIISRIDKLSEKDLVRLLEVYSQKKISFNLTESSLQLFSKTVNRVQETCKEFEDPNHLISATYYLLNLEMTDVARNVIMQANELVSKFDAKQLCNILFLTASNKDITITKIQRNKIVSLLKEFDLSELSVKILNKLLYTCGVLNIYDSDLLETVTSVIKQAYSQRNIVVSNTDLMRTITSLGKLRWKDSVLIELTLNLFEPFTLNNTQPILSALACLDYNIPDDLKYLTEQLYAKVRFLSPLKKLDLVWTLVILDRANRDHIASIINPKFIASVCTDLSSLEKDPKFSDVMKIQKLQNLSLAGRLEFDLPAETMLLNSFIFDMKGTFMSNSLSEMLLLALSKICPSDSIDSKTVIGGHFIDAFLYLNFDNAIEKLENITPENLEKHHRICIKIQGFNDTLLNEVGPTGPFRLSIKHLTRLGFKVIVVPYQLFSSKDTTGIQTFIKHEIDKIGIVNC